MAGQKAEHTMAPSSTRHARDQSDISSGLVSRQKFTRRWLWICGAVGVMAAATILLLFGISTWTAIAFLMLLACPGVVAWVLIAERKQRLQSPRSKT